MKLNEPKISLILFLVAVTILLSVILILAGNPKEPVVVLKEIEAPLRGELIESKLDNPTEVVKIDALKTEIDDLQAGIVSGEKYTQVLRTTNKDGIDYSVTEYKTPDGSTGYQKILYLDNGEIISEGFGVEASHRTYHYIPEVSLVTPTST